VTLARDVAGVHFNNPILLASGTAGFARELAGVVALDRVGGLVTKAVSLEPREGNLPPRVAELDGGMLNSVGLANPGVEVVRREALPWISTHIPALRVLVNVVGFTVDEYARTITRLDDIATHVAYELNLSCPNTAAGGVEFGADPALVGEVVASCRRATRRPIFVKLSPALPNVAVVARAARDAGADGLTLVNTMPGTAFLGGTPRVGNGFGGVSGPGLLPIGLLAVSRVADALPGVPIIGVGGVSRVEHVRDYLRAGASLVAIGTAALADPRLPERLVAQLEQQHG
jgi:dihydroorotate dehydrogenase (NAD+) catalytic subunit